jgi:hypothetical protein
MLTGNSNYSLEDTALQRAGFERFLGGVNLERYVWIKSEIPFNVPSENLRKWLGASLRKWEIYNLMCQKVFQCFFHMVSIYACNNRL